MTEGASLLNRCRGITAAAHLAAAAVLSPAGKAQILYAGVNLSGAEFGGQNLPGMFGTDYTYPTHPEVDYYNSKGMNTFRLPIRWERRQPTPNSPFNTSELNRLNALITYATSRGANVIIDPHNFARYYPPSSNIENSTTSIAGSSTIRNSEFVDFWSAWRSSTLTIAKVIFRKLPGAGR